MPTGENGEKTVEKREANGTEGDVGGRAMSGDIGVSQTSPSGLSQVAVLRTRFRRTRFLQTGAGFMRN
jgi:hypothetical protein